MNKMNAKLFQKAMAPDAGAVLVEFMAPWCVYCRRIEPALEKLSQELGGSLDIYQVNIDQEPLLAHNEMIEVVPTFVLYRSGEALGSIVAPESKAKIQEFLREHLN
jgi:thioredoxin-like negative regulator of GroEL